jgi:DNA-binding transcriptional MerR regulator
MSNNMPESELSRVEMHQDDIDQRDLIHNQDYIQVAEIKRVLDKHTADNANDFKQVNDRLNGLMPLADLIPVLQEMAESKKISDGINKRFASIGRILAAISGAIMALGVILGTTWVIIQMMIKFKE